MGIGLKHTSGSETTPPSAERPDPPAIVQLFHVKHRRRYTSGGSVRGQHRCVQLAGVRLERIHILLHKPLPREGKERVILKHGLLCDGIPRQPMGGPEHGRMWDWCMLREIHSDAQAGHVVHGGLHLLVPLEGGGRRGHTRGWRSGERRRRGDFPLPP